MYSPKTWFSCRLFGRIKHGSCSIVKLRLARMVVNAMNGWNFYRTYEIHYNFTPTMWPDSLIQFQTRPRANLALLLIEGIVISIDTVLYSFKHMPFRHTVIRPDLCKSGLRNPYQLSIHSKSIILISGSYGCSFNSKCINFNHAKHIKFVHVHDCPSCVFFERTFVKYSELYFSS